MASRRRAPPRRAAVPPRRAAQRRSLAQGPLRKVCGLWPRFPRCGRFGGGTLTPPPSSRTCSPARPCFSPGAQNWCGNLTLAPRYYPHVCWRCDSRATSRARPRGAARRQAALHGRRHLVQPPRQGRMQEAAVAQGRGVGGRAPGDLRGLRLRGRRVPQVARRQGRDGAHARHRAGLCGRARAAHVARVCRSALACGWCGYQYTLSLSATQFWSKAVRRHLPGGKFPPLSEAYTAHEPERPIGAHSEISTPAHGSNGYHLTVARVEPR
jgi:hypothetical protein